MLGRVSFSSLVVVGMGTEDVELDEEFDDEEGDMVGIS